MKYDLLVSSYLDKLGKPKYKNSYVISYEGKRYNKNANSPEQAKTFVGREVAQKINLKNPPRWVISKVLQNAKVVEEKPNEETKPIVYEQKAKRDRCLRRADSVYGKKTSAYKSGAVVKCRQGKIWKKSK
jgi:hypothetical protein